MSISTAWDATRPPRAITSSASSGGRARSSTRACPVISEGRARRSRRSPVERAERGGRLAAGAAALACALLLLSSRATPAQDTPPVAAYPVGIRQLEFVDQDRHIALAVFYPAVLRDRAAPLFTMPFFANLGLYRDVEVASAGAPLPLVVFSHGRRSHEHYYELGG